MTIRHDLDKGWVTSDEEPRWRANATAVRRLEGQEVKWTNVPRRGHVGMVGSWTAVVIRRYPTRQSWIAKIDGFEFWQHVRVLNQEIYVPGRAFNKIDDALRFVKTVLKQVGAD